MGPLLAILVVVLIIFIWYINTYNSIKVLKIKIDESLSGIDVALTKRYDVLTKMVDVCKSYKQHETELLTQVISLRSGMSMQDRNNASRQMDVLAGKINVLAENYPELKSSNNFVELQKAIVDVEEHLQAARRLYNSNVTAYNAKIVMFPNNIVAGAMAATAEEFFVAEDVKRQDVSMNF